MDPVQKGVTDLLCRLPAAGMDQDSFENTVQDWMNDGFESGWNGETADEPSGALFLLHSDHSIINIGTTNAKSRGLPLHGGLSCTLLHLLAYGDTLQVFMADPPHQCKYPASLPAYITKYPQGAHQWALPLAQGA